MAPSYKLELAIFSAQQKIQEGAKCGNISTKCSDKPYQRKIKKSRSGSKMFYGKMLHGQMLHGQMLPGQMLHVRMLHGQMLNGKMVLGHLSTVKDGSINLKCPPWYFPWGGGG